MLRSMALNDRLLATDVSVARAKGEVVDILHVGSVDLAYGTLQLTTK
jgi:hypothetical protein